MIVEMEVCGRRVVYNERGLSTEEFAELQRIAQETMLGAQGRFLPALERCTFFAEFGYEPLAEALEGRHGVSNPRTEGCDDNPFDQHYWIGFDFEGPRATIVDPIFGYVGLQEHAGDVLDAVHTRYYAEKRTVPKGQVRVKTFGL